MSDVWQDYADRQRSAAAARREEAPRGDRGEGGEGVPLRVVPLSYGAYSDRSPVVTFWSKGALLRASRDIPGHLVGGGQRGEIKGFTAASRLRLFRTLAKIDRSAGLPCFMSLTYHERWPDSPAEWKYQLKERLVKQLIREFGIAGVWKLEPQKRLAPHTHSLIWGAEAEALQERVPSLWNEIAGYGSRDHLLWHEGKLGNRPCVEPVFSWQFVTRYAAKYLGKEIEWENVGRFWGVFNRNAVPWGEEITLAVSDAKVLEFMRAMRRYAHLRGRDYKSLSVMCGADHWIDKLWGDGVLSGEEVP